MQLDEDRPAKRRKTMHESSEDANTSAYHQLTTLLNGSSRDSPILNLSNLHNIIQYVLCIPPVKSSLHSQGEIFLSTGPAEAERSRTATTAYRLGQDRLRRLAMSASQQSRLRALAEAQVHAL